MTTKLNHTNPNGKGSNRRGFLTGAGKAVAGGVAALFGMSVAAKEAAAQACYPVETFCCRDENDYPNECTAYSCTDGSYYYDCRPEPGCPYLEGDNYCP